MHVGYERSLVERLWAGRVATLNPTGCAPWKAGGALDLLARETASTASTDPHAHSHMLTCRPCATRGTVAAACNATRTIADRHAIEPLTSFLRDPRALVSPNVLEHVFQKSWLLLPSRDELARVRREGGRYILVDLGAGLYDVGGRTPGAVGGASLRWFDQQYAARGAAFDRVLAFEARPLSQRDLWRSMPAALVPRLQYFNAPAQPAAGAKFNPWRILREVATPRDYVVVKLDVDNAALELALVRQLLDHRSGAAALVDELFWEHHVAGSPLGCPRLWRAREPAGRGWAGMKFNLSEPDETLAGSYALFHALRSMGIRAHSWV